MKYKIICPGSSNDLEEKVRDAIYEGWLPLGGVAFCEFERETADGKETVVTFVQAMTS